MTNLSKKVKTALLFGATGLVGRACLSYLLDSPVYDKVVTFGRRILEEDHPKLEQQIVDFNRLKDYGSLLVGDDVYCCLGTTMKKAGSKEAFYKVDFTYCDEIAKIASANGAQQFLLVSSIGAYSNSMFFYNKVKGQLENAVKHYPFQSVHIFRPAVLMGKREEGRFGETVGISLGKAFNFATSGKLLKYRPIDGDQVAKAMVVQAEIAAHGIHIYESDVIQKI